MFKALGRNRWLEEERAMNSRFDDSRSIHDVTTLKFAAPSEEDDLDCDDSQSEEIKGGSTARIDKLPRLHA